MSTPAQERAAWLSETAFNALHAARGSFGNAAHVTAQVDTYLKNSKEDVLYLPEQADRIRTAADGESRPYVTNAQQLAGEADRRIHHAQEGVQEVRGHLEQTARALHAGREALTELASLPVQQDTAALVRLSYTMGALDTAVKSAQNRMNETSRSLSGASDSLAPLVHGANRHGQEATAGVINQAATAANAQLTGTRQGLDSLREGFETGEIDAHAAAAESSELARHFAAAANPTPSGAQQPQAAAADEAHKPKESEIASRLRGL